MTFVEVWAKNTKSMLQNASKNSIFGPSILIFLPDLHECQPEILHAVRKFINVHHKNIHIFWIFFTIFLDFTVQPGSLELGITYFRKSYLCVRVLLLLSTSGTPSGKVG